MKRFIVAVIVSHCFVSNLASQKIEIVSATKEPWSQQAGGMNRRRDFPLDHGTNYNITLHCKNLNAIVLDSLYIDYTRAKLIINDNVKVDSLKQTYTISISSTEHANDVQLAGSGKIIKQVDPNCLLISTSGFILYKYKGKKHKVYIKEITERINNGRKNYKPC
jgi:hypothetical protein